MFGLVIWTIEIITHALNLEFQMFPGVLYTRLFDVLFLKVLGCVLITGGLIVFILSLISFGRSWRIGIDTEHAGVLVTSGIFSITRNPICFINKGI